MTTRVAVLTADGRGAIAVVRLWGPDAVAIADRAFRPARGRRLADGHLDRPRFGRLGAGLGDEVVAVLLGTDPPEAEIQCHGGPAAIQLVLEALVAEGATPANADDWVTQSAASRIQAEATIDLARTPTVLTAEILLDQAAGALDRELADLAALLDNHPDKALASLDVLLARSTLGRRLVEGWRVAFAGRPNVGKSRLLNALVGFDRAIVDPTPGTTRDVVTARVAFQGWPIELADTAGLRDADDAIEAAGVARARAQHAEADLILLILDGSEPLGGEDQRLIEQFPQALILASKADLPQAWDSAARGWPAISAETGAGIEALIAAIAHRLVPDPPSPGAGVPFRQSHVDALIHVQTRLRASQSEDARAWLAEWIG